MTAIDPPAPKAFVIEPQRCEWWEDDGALWISMRRDPSLFGGLDSLVATLKLEALPTGAARNYALKSDSLRAAMQFAIAQARFVSQMGVAAVYREDGDRLRIHFRAFTVRHSLTLLGGWSRGARTLWLGTLTATKAHAPRTNEVTQTESNGFSRNPATSQPTEKTP